MVEHDASTSSAAVTQKPRTGRKTLLTPEIQQTIVASIRAGMWDYIAAEAAGIHQDTFYEWLRRGSEGFQGRPPEPPYSEFSVAVIQARAHARGTAEIAVRQESPSVYLTRGPGRDQPGRPGWTNNADGSMAQAQTTVVNVLMSTNWQDVQARVLAALVKHPDARADVLAALAPLLEAQTSRADADIAEAHDDPDASNRD
jgi:hypothetical protein